VFRVCTSRVKRYNESSLKRQVPVREILLNWIETQPQKTGDTARAKCQASLEVRWQDGAAGDRYSTYLPIASRQDTVTTAA
jgi:hypothetical protein